uniref:Solute carrier family 66 member 3 n=1 Tax=Electrophorus electricus TaxID=8005 RepID=A0AAY5ENM9_ELEEL
MDTSEETMSPLKAFLLSYFMPEKCYEHFFHHLNLTHGETHFLERECYKPWLTCFEILFAFPPLSQIWRLLWAGSSEGLSLLSALLDLLVVSVHVALCIHLKFPIGAWGESLFILIQYAVVTFLIQYYRGNTGVLLVAYGGFMYLLTSPLTSQAMVRAAREWNVLIIIASRLTQVACNHSSGYTGQLSGLYVFLMFLGSLGHMFSSIQETGHSLRTQAWLLAVSCSGLLLAQVLLFHNQQPVPGKIYQQKKQEKDEKKKK